MTPPPCPVGFFEVNPAMDLPPSKNKASKEMLTDGSCCKL